MNQQSKPQQSQKAITNKPTGIKKGCLNIVFIFGAVIGLIAIGILITLLFKRPDKVQLTTEEYNASFGNLSNPLEYNVTDGVTINSSADEPEVQVISTVYAVNESDPFFPSVILSEQTASKLTLTNESETSTGVIYSNENGDTLEYSDGNKFILLKYSKTATQTSSDLTESSKAEILAKKQLEDIGLWPFTEDEYKTTFSYYVTVDMSYTEVATAEEANMIEVNFSQIIDGKPLVNQSIDSGEIAVLFNRANEVFKIEYMYRPVDKNKSATYPTKSFSYALTQLQSGIGELVLPFYATESKDITLTSAAFAYKIVSDNQQYLVPVYIFDGINEDSQPVSLLLFGLDDSFIQKDPNLPK